MTSVVLSGDFLRNTRAITVADGGGVTWAFDKLTNTLSVSALSGSAIAANSVTNTELADMAQATIKGRAAAAGTGDPQDLTATQVKTILALTSADLSDFTEAAQDAVLNAGVDSTTIDFTYNDGAGTWTVQVIDDSITDARLRNSVGVSVIGRSASSTGDPADIVAGANDRILRRVTNALDFGQLTAGMFPNTVVPDAALSTNAALRNTTNSWAADQVPDADGTRALGGSGTRWTVCYAGIVSDGTTAAGALLSSSGTTARVAAGSAWQQLDLYANNAVRVSIDSAGRLFGKNLHDNASSPTGTTNHYIASGTYTPTLTGVANVASSTPSKCQWLRVGNVVHVSGLITVDPTSASVTTTVGVSLPIASNLTAATDLAGTAVSYEVTALAGGIFGDTTNDRASLQYITADTAARTLAMHFTYEVK